MKNPKFPLKINLANLPTPIQKINFNEQTFFMKRDDLTGLETSGNKIRKLEYLLFQAKKEKADYVFSCGGEQSNHCRATAFAAASLGIKSKLFLWGKDSKIADGNLFLNKFINAEIKFINRKEYSNVNQIMFDENKVYENRNKKIFIISEGGSSPLGIWGYINFIYELKLQIQKNNFNSILIPCGSCGTAAGLLIGCELFGMNYKIFTVNVLYSKEEMFTRIINLIQCTNEEFNLNLKFDSKSFAIENRLEILDGYSEEGYKNISDEKLSLIKNFAVQTGIILDPAYTGKSFFAFNNLFLSKNKISKTLFVHTGGLFGVFNKRKKYLELS